MIPLKLRPGVFNNGTRNQAKGRWFTANLMRWYEGVMGPIGGWQTVNLVTPPWVASNAYAINALIIDSNKNIQVCTHAGTSGLAAPVWATAIGAGTNDNGINWVNLGPNGNSMTTTPKGFTAVWAAAVTFDLNFYIVDSNGALQQITTAGTTGATVPVWNTTVGGTTADNTAVWTNRGKPGLTRGTLGWKTDNGTSYMAIGTNTRLLIYSDNVMIDATPSGLVAGLQDGSYASGGFGTGAFGTGPFGRGSAAQTLKLADTWQVDNYGRALVASLTSDGKLYYWDPNTGGAAIPVGAAAGNTVPTQNRGVVVTPERFLVALGANGDPRNVAWANQEDPLTATIWNPASTNSAGSFLLSTKGRLMAGRRSRRQTLLWTDVDAYAMTFLGPSGQVYAFEQIGDNCGLIAPNAMVVLGDVAFWMSYGKFFVYDGALKPLQCDVLDYVFQNLSLQQRSKICAVSNALFDEVIWFYPSKGSSGENDSYVAYNYREAHWMIGSLPRSGGIDRGVFDNPLYIGADSFLYSHELGQTRQNYVLKPFAESGPVEITDVDMHRGFSGSFEVMAVNRYIPDQRTVGATALELSLADVNMTMFFAYFPTDTEKQIGPFPALQQTHLHFQGRSVRLRVDEVNPVLWRLGIPRLAAVPGGRR